MQGSRVDDPHRVVREAENGEDDHEPSAAFKAEERFREESHHELAIHFLVYAIIEKNGVLD
jgi:hypothetical protein